MNFDILYEKIKEYDKIMIFGHVRPDGDCYGSLNGLKDIIKTSFPKKSVFCLTSQVEFLSFVGKMDDVEDEEFIDSLAIICDTSTRERICDKRYTLCKEKIKIDHHVIIDNYGDYNIVDEDISATSLLICRFLFSYPDLKITPKGANALYTGIITDTSNFRYRGVNLETFTLAGRLIEMGVDVSFIDKNLSSESLRATKLKAFIYRSLKVTKHGVVYAKLTKTTIKYYNVSYDEAASLVTLLSNIKECPVWILIINYPKEIRVRIRSNGPDINKLAEKYGGGGHQKAAGTSLKSFSKVKSLLKDADELVRCYKDDIPHDL
ncbi:MAG: bifunctional oligoribonuclease/PAP phosphatase NrnA [Erysipelotrichaceae bacterium]|nr:bifunctional oligoribonuclease/PAP phosphatase NrnA [Erysipelotrichaceae bacterium]